MLSDNRCASRAMFAIKSHRKAGPVFDKLKGPKLASVTREGKEGEEVDVLTITFSGTGLAKAESESGKTII